MRLSRMSVLRYVTPYCVERLRLVPVRREKNHIDYRVMKVRSSLDGEHLKEQDGERYCAKHKENRVAGD